MVFIGIASAEFWTLTPGQMIDLMIMHDVKRRMQPNGF